MVISNVGEKEGMVNLVYHKRYLFNRFFIHSFYSFIGYGDIFARGNVASQLGDYLPWVDLGSGRTARQISGYFSH